MVLEALKGITSLMLMSSEHVRTDELVLESDDELYERESSSSSTFFLTNGTHLGSNISFSS